MTIQIPTEEIRLKRMRARRGWVIPPKYLPLGRQQTPFRVFTGLGDIYNRKFGSFHNPTMQRYVPGRHARHPVQIDDQGVPYQSGIDNYGIVDSLQPILNFRTEWIATRFFETQKKKLLQP